jgi:ribosomal protein S12 methylthiotransferase
MQTQARISATKLATRIGAVEDVLVDMVSSGGAVGRTKRDAPEIDGQVHIEGNHQFSPGQLVRVKITGAQEHDLVGEFA